MKTLQEIFEQDAGGKFPFRVCYAEHSFPETIIGWSVNQLMVGENKRGEFTRYDPDTVGWIFVQPEKPKVIRSLWVEKKGPYYYPCTRYRPTNFLTDAEAKERGYFRKIPGTEMEFDE